MSAVARCRTCIVLLLLSDKVVRYSRLHINLGQLLWAIFAYFECCKAGLKKPPPVRWIGRTIKEILFLIIRKWDQICKNSVLLTFYNQILKYMNWLRNYRNYFTTTRRINNINYGTNVPLDYFLNSSRHWFREDLYKISIFLE